MEYNLSQLDERFRAIGILQNLRDRNRPGSYSYEKADLGITLALNQTRTVDGYLIRNLLRDGRRILRRRKETAAEVAPFNLGDTNHHPRDGGGTPEEIAAAEQSKTRICRAPASRRFASRCLEGLLTGETSEETAIALGISTGYVKKIRAELRAAAGPLLRGVR